MNYERKILNYLTNSNVPGNPSRIMADPVLHRDSINLKRTIQTLIDDPSSTIRIRKVLSVGDRILVIFTRNQSVELILLDWDLQLIKYYNQVVDRGKPTDFPNIINAFFVNYQDQAKVYFLVEISSSSLQLLELTQIWTRDDIDSKTLMVNKKSLPFINPLDNSNYEMFISQSQSSFILYQGTSSWIHIITIQSWTSQPTFNGKIWEKLPNTNLFNFALSHDDTSLYIMLTILDHCQEWVDNTFRCWGSKRDSSFQDITEVWNRLEDAGCSNIKLTIAKYDSSVWHNQPNCRAVVTNFSDVNPGDTRSWEIKLRWWKNIREWVTFTSKPTIRWDVEFSPWPTNQKWDTYTVFKTLKVNGQTFQRVEANKFYRFLYDDSDELVEAEQGSVHGWITWDELPIAHFNPRHHSRYDVNIGDISSQTDFNFEYVNKLPYNTKSKTIVRKWEGQSTEDLESWSDIIHQPKVHFNNHNNKFVFTGLRLGQYGSNLINYTPKEGTISDSVGVNPMNPSRPTDCVSYDGKNFSRFQMLWATKDRRKYFLCLPHIKDFYLTQVTRTFNSSFEIFNFWFCFRKNTNRLFLMNDTYDNGQIYIWTQADKGYKSSPYFFEPYHDSTYNQDFTMERLSFDKNTSLLDVDLDDKYVTKSGLICNVKINSDLLDLNANSLSIYNNTNEKFLTFSNVNLQKRTNTKLNINCKTNFCFIDNTNGTNTEVELQSENMASCFLDTSHLARLKPAYLKVRRDDGVLSNFVNIDPSILTLVQDQVDLYFNIESRSLFDQIIIYNDNKQVLAIKNLLTPQTRLDVKFIMKFKE